MALIDYTQGSINNTTNQTGVTAQTGNNTLAGTQNQAYVYTPQQQSLQGLAGNFISNMLSTGQPGPFQVNPAQAEYANYLFNRNVAPRIAASLGPNSPGLWGAQQELNLGLAAQGTQQAMNNAMSAYQAAQQYAFTPVGANSTANQTGTQTQNTNQQQTTNMDQNSKQWIIDGGGLLDLGETTLQGLAGYASNL